jgi:hypothetical protein
MTIRFPFPIRQVADNKIEVDTQPGCILHPEFLTRMERWEISPALVLEIEREARDSAIRASMKVIE